MDARILQVVAIGARSVILWDALRRCGHKPPRLRLLASTPSPMGGNGGDKKGSEAYGRRLERQRLKRVARAKEQGRTLRA